MCLQTDSCRILKFILNALFRFIHLTVEKTFTQNACLIEVKVICVLYLSIVPYHGVKLWLHEYI
jgi:hypothetical protein